MGNACVINCNIPLDELISFCWRRTCSTRESFRSLQTDWERLRAAKNEVQTKIKVDVRGEMTMLETVSNWLQEVESIEIEFHKLKRYYDQQSANKRFCCYCSTNVNARYTFGKNVANVKKVVDSLMERKPDEVAQESAITIHTERPIRPTIGMHTTLAEAWNYMEDEQIGIISLYGMGGVGKTTLMTELNNKLCHSPQSFDVVFWIVISSTLNLSKVQNEIGSGLGFQSDEWKEKSQDRKSMDIYNSLRQKRFVLFLDDVWQYFDLLSLGVPRPDGSNKSKIVLTTRSRDVCGHMEAHKIIQVTCLNEEEAYNLFREKVGENTINIHPEIQEIAKLVAKECDGLPLALIVIGRAMASKLTPRAWNTSLNRLRKYGADFAGMRDHVLPLLKFSYDNIPNSAVKSCLLYCSLYPEDDFIYRYDLIEKWICEGFLDEFVDLEEATNEGYDYIDTLINASLLEDCGHDVIKMHDIIREMTIWIGCECGEIKNKFFVRAGVGLIETPNIAEFQCSERMSLMKNEIKKLTGKPNCPNLLTLFLNGGNKVNHIDNEFFQFMGKLRVLDLSYNAGLREIPEGICNLVTLQYLNLSETRISKLPINLHKLINLKWFGFPMKMSPIPEGLLSCFKKLQVLQLYHTGVGLLPQTFVEEVEGLKYLNELGIKIATDIYLSRFSSSQKLASITKSLELTNQATSTYLDLLFSPKIMNLVSLRIDYCYQLEYLISREINGASKIINYDYIQCLKMLQLFGCPKLKNITVLTFDPNLELIDVFNCDGMKELCDDWIWDQEGMAPIPFPKLKFLRFVNLEQFERIYPNAPPLFPCLVFIYLDKCPKLKKLPFNSTSCKSGRGLKILGEQEWWDGLEWEDEATRTAFLHSFGSKRIPT